MAKTATIKFKRINGWSYKTEDNKFMISHTGADRYWFSAEIDEEATTKFGWAIPEENTKQYHTTLGEAQQWVRSFNYKEGK